MVCFSFVRYEVDLDAVVQYSIDLPSARIATIAAIHNLSLCMLLIAGTYGCQNFLFLTASPHQTFPSGTKPSNTVNFLPLSHRHQTLNTSAQQRGSHDDGNVEYDANLHT